MNKSEITELYYFILSFILLFVFILFYGLAFSLQELSLKISFTEMSNTQSLIYFWLIFMFLITLSRQIKLKFRSYYPNLILIILGLILMLYFNIFSQNTRSYQLTIKEGTMIYKTDNFTKGYITFRILQLFILIILILSSLNILRRNKKHST
jgi:drug/metabolite transporter (DMT)-like permease